MLSHHPYCAFEFHGVDNLNCSKYVSRFHGRVCGYCCLRACVRSSHGIASAIRSSSRSVVSHRVIGIVAAGWPKCSCRTWDFLVVMAPKRKSRRARGSGAKRRKRAAHRLSPVGEEGFGPVDEHGLSPVGDERRLSPVGDNPVGDDGLGPVAEDGLAPVAEAEDGLGPAEEAAEGAGSAGSAQSTSTVAKCTQDPRARPWGPKHTQPRKTSWVH